MIFRLEMQNNVMRIITSIWMVSKARYSCKNRYSPLFMDTFCVLPGIVDNWRRFPAHITLTQRPRHILALWRYHFKEMWNIIYLLHRMDHSLKQYPWLFFSVFFVFVSTSLFEMRRQTSAQRMCSAEMIDGKWAQKKWKNRLNSENEIHDTTCFFFLLQNDSFAFMALFTTQFKI